MRNIEHDQSILLIKNKVLDKILLASILLGIVASFFALIRDLQFKFEHLLLYALSNLGLIGLVILMYIYRKRISLFYKSILLSAIYLFAGLKSMAMLGTLPNPYVLISIAFLILQLFVNQKWVVYILFIGVVGLSIFLNNYFSANPFHIHADYNELMNSKQQFAASISLFAMLVFFILISVETYQKEIQRVIDLVERQNHELNLKNELLDNEITKMKKYEHEVLINSKKFQLLFESSQDGIILTDNDLKILEVNPALCDIFDISHDKLIGMSILDLVGPKNKSLIINRLYKLMDGEEPTLAEMTTTTKAGDKIVVEFNSNIIIGEEKNLTIISTIRDVTSRKKVQDQKFDAVLEAEENERERFSRDLHDELGPLFSTVKLYVESLRSRETKDHQVKILDKLLEIINSGVKQIREISHNLSPYLLREKGLQKAMETHIKRVKESTSLIIDMDTSLGEWEDKLPQNTQILIYRVFLELMNNAIKHSKASHLNIHLSIVNDSVFLVFSDDGIGFDTNIINNEQSGIGLKNIMNRIRAKNGEMVFSFDKIMKTEIILPI